MDEPIKMEEIDQALKICEEQNWHLGNPAHKIGLRALRELKRLKIPVAVIRHTDKPGCVACPCKPRFELEGYEKFCSQCSAPLNWSVNPWGGE